MLRRSAIRCSLLVLSLLVCSVAGSAWTPDSYSIALYAYPGTLCDLGSSSTMSVYVENDGVPVPGHTIEFSAAPGDGVSFTPLSTAVTNPEGWAQVTFHPGSWAGDIKITATDLTFCEDPEHTVLCGQYPTVNQAERDVRVFDPTVPAVSDGAQYTTGTLHAIWTLGGSYVDPGWKPYSEYRIRDDSNPGAPYPFGEDWTPVLLALEVTRTDLILMDGHTYVFEVRAHYATCNSAVGSSDGVTADASQPSAPTVTAEVTGDPTQITATWSVADPHSGITECQYAIGTSETDPGSDYIKDWTSTGTGTTGDATGVSLCGTYYFYVKARNGAGLWSNVGVSNGVAYPPVVATIGGLFSLTLGSRCQVQDKVCTAGNDQFDGEFYIEEPDGNAGVRVIYSATTVPAGKLVTVCGHVDNDASCNEFTFYADEVSVGADAPLPEAIEKIPAEIGGCDTGNAIGVTDCCQEAPCNSQYNKGLLLSTGADGAYVTYIDPGLQFFYIQDNASPLAPDDGFDDGYGVRVSFDRLQPGNAIDWNTIYEGGYVRLRGIGSSEVLLGHDGITRTIRVVRPRSTDDVRPKITFNVPPQPLRGVQPIDIIVSHFVPPLSAFALQLDGMTVDTSYLDSNYDTGQFQMQLDARWLDEGEHTLEACVTHDSGEVCDSTVVETARGNVRLTSNKNHLHVSAGGSPLEECAITATVQPTPPVNTVVEFSCYPIDAGSFTNVTTTNASGEAAAVFHAGATPGSCVVAALTEDAGGEPSILWISEDASQLVFVAPDYYTVASTSTGCVGRACVMVRDANDYKAADGTPVSYSFTGPLVQVSSTPTVDGLSEVTFRSTTALVSEGTITATAGVAGPVTANVHIVAPTLSGQVDRFADSNSAQGASIALIASAPKGATCEGISVEFHWDGECSAAFAPSAVAVTDSTGAAEVSLVGVGSRGTGLVWATAGSECMSRSQMLTFTAPDAVRLSYERTEDPESILVSAVLWDVASGGVADGTELTFTTSAGTFDTCGAGCTTLLATTADSLAFAELTLPQGEATTITATCLGLSPVMIDIANPEPLPLRIEVIAPTSPVSDYATTNTVHVKLKLLDGAGQPVTGTQVHFVCSNGGVVTHEWATTDGVSGVVENDVTVSSQGRYELSVTAQGITNVCLLAFTGSPSSFGDYSIYTSCVGGAGGTNSYRFGTRAVDSAGLPIVDGSTVEFDINGVYVASGVTNAGWVGAALSVPATSDAINVTARVSGIACERTYAVDGLSNWIDSVNIPFTSRSMPFSPTYGNRQRTRIPIKVLDRYGSSVPNGTPVHLEADYGWFQHIGGTFASSIELGTSGGYAFAPYYAPKALEPLAAFATITATCGGLSDTATIVFTY